MGNSFFIGIAVAILVPDHRVADQFHHQPHAHPQRLDADQCGAADLCDPVVVPGHPFYAIMGKYGLTNNPLRGDRG
jgi:hypothetical protein